MHFLSRIKINSKRILLLINIWSLLTLLSTAKQVGICKSLHYVGTNSAFRATFGISTYSVLSTYDNARTVPGDGRTTLYTEPSQAEYWTFPYTHKLTLSATSLCNILELASSITLWGIYFAFESLGFRGAHVTVCLLYFTANVIRSPSLFSEWITSDGVTLQSILVTNWRV